MNAKNTTPPTEATKTKQRDPLLVAAALASKLGKARASLAKAKANVIARENEIAKLEKEAGPQLWQTAKRILGEP